MIKRTGRQILENIEKEQMFLRGEIRDLRSAHAELREEVSRIDTRWSKVASDIVAKRASVIQAVVGGVALVLSALVAAIVSLVTGS